jgi:hypothetical protein
MPEQFYRSRLEKQYISNLGVYRCKQGLKLIGKQIMLDKEFTEEIICYTNNCGHIDRYFSKDHLAAFEVSSSNILSGQPTLNRPPSASTKAELKSIFQRYEKFSKNGILVIVQKSLYDRKQLLLSP